MRHGGAFFFTGISKFPVGLGREVYIGDDGGYDWGSLLFDRTCGSCLFYPMGFVFKLGVSHSSCSFLLLFFFVFENILVYQFTQ